jgi:hypothetical protein
LQIPCHQNSAPSPDRFLNPCLKPSCSLFEPKQPGMNLQPSEVSLKSPRISHLANGNARVTGRPVSLDALPNDFTRKSFTTLTLHGLHSQEPPSHGFSLTSRFGWGSVTAQWYTSCFGLQYNAGELPDSPVSRHESIRGLGADKRGYPYGILHPDRDRTRVG